MNFPTFLSGLSKVRSDGRKVRYAVVGAGWIAQEDFLPAIARTGNSVVTALVSGDAVKRAELGKRYDIPTVCDYDGIDALLGSGKIDALYLATPNAQHWNIAVRALKAKVHVLCEKPMAQTEAQCQAMIDASEQGGAKLMIAYRLHFEEGNVSAVETVQSGALGELRFFSSVFGQQVEAGNSRTRAETWANPMPDMGPYPINAVRHLFQAEPTEVFAVAASKNEPRFAEIPEMISVVLRFPEERLATFTVSYGVNPVDGYRVVGTQGSLEVSNGYSFHQGATHRLTVGTKTSERSFKLVDQFGGETRYFSDCVLDDRHPEPDGAEGLADVRVIRAIEESLGTGRPEQLAPAGAPALLTQERVEKQRSTSPGKMVHAAPPEGS